MTIEISRAGRERVPDIARLMARAFAGDPMVTWPLPPGSTEEHVRLMFQWLEEPIAELGMLWEASRGLGAAAWFPPGHEATFVEIDREVRRRMASLFDDGGGRYASFWDWLTENMPDEPHWYLDHIGVDAEHRGRGVGRALIEWGLAMAKADGVPAFLETARSGNVPIYEHLGFRVVLDGDAPGGGPHIWFLRHDP
ncbi:MAG TPA: GNAT family N-acetyltransferase [Actinomycetota bacterium]